MGRCSRVRSSFSPRELCPVGWRLMEQSPEEEGAASRYCWVLAQCLCGTWGGEELGMSWGVELAVKGWEKYFKLCLWSLLSNCILIGKTKKISGFAQESKGCLCLGSANTLGGEMQLGCLSQEVLTFPPVCNKHFWGFFCFLPFLKNFEASFLLSSRRKNPKSVHFCLPGIVVKLFYTAEAFFLSLEVFWVFFCTIL